MNGPIITTWADGWGAWHATVVREHADAAARMCARRAILAELTVRGNGAPIVVHVRCVARRIDADGIGWYEYAER